MAPPRLNRSFTSNSLSVEVAVVVCRLVAVAAVASVARQLSIRDTCPGRRSGGSGYCVAVLRSVHRSWGRCGSRDAGACVVIHAPACSCTVQSTTRARWQGRVVLGLVRVQGAMAPPRLNRSFTSMLLSVEVAVVACRLVAVAAVAAVARQLSIRDICPGRRCGGSGYCVAVLRSVHRSWGRCGSQDAGACVVTHAPACSCTVQSTIRTRW